MGQTPDEIRREIDETREHMSETVLALQQKLNVPARVKGRVVDVKQDVEERLERSWAAGKEKASGSLYVYAAAGALALAGVVSALVLRARSGKGAEEQ